MNKEIKEWYKVAYPEDTLGNNINSNVSFSEMLYRMEALEDAYDIIGVEDSLLRERVFEKLSEVCECDYEVIFDLWLES